MNGHGEKLSRQQERVVAALLLEPTHEKAAERAEIGVATLRRWLKLPHFLAAYRAARREVVEGAVAALQQAGNRAVETLVKNLDAEKASDSNRAALTILDLAFRGADLLDLAQRMEVLEARLSNEGKKKR